MNPAQLLTHFDRISEAPDAVPRLRRFILDLAVRGKLVEQDPDDEPVSELLKRIQSGRAQLVKEGIGRKEDAPTADESNRAPFPTPAHWAWLPVNRVGALSGGMTPSKSRPDFWDGRINWFSPKDVKSDALVESELKITPAAVAETGLQLYPPGCLFMVARSGILKRTFPVAINRTEGTVNQDLKVLRPFLVGMERYLQLMFRGMTDYILTALVKTGTTVQSLKYDDFEMAFVPLPPLAEQHRIVAKVDELMGLCDRLEAAQTERETRRDRVVAASLNRLNEPAADDAEPFRDHARFHLRHLPRLSTRPEHIQQLRQTILNLAVRGRLVPQDGRDRPAATQLESSDLMRRRTAVDDRRADVARQTLLAADDRWPVPDPWEWRAVADVALFIDYRGRTPPKAEAGIRLITAKNVRRGTINVAPVEFLSEAEYGRWMTRGHPRSGDVLFTTEAPMGNAAVVRLTERFALAQRVICLRPYGALDPEFAVLQILAQPFQGLLERTSTGLTAKGIKAAKLKRLPLAVPPLAEQHRIVARYAELMAVCDRLEAQLRSAQADSRRLLEAALHLALSPIA